MKKREYILNALVVVVLLGVLFWSQTTPPATPSAVTLLVETNSPSGGPSFRIRNDGKPAIFLMDVFVETNSPVGWEAVDPTQNDLLIEINTGGAMPLDVVPPDKGTPWRVRVTYGTEMKGARLLLGKVKFAISYRKIPGPGWWVTTGTNSCVSPEISN